MTTHKELVTLAAAWLRKTHSVVITEISSGGGECPDAIGFTGSWSTMIECKASRADFRADAVKGFRAHPPLGMGQYRYYMAPAGIISPGDLPPSWGLLEAKDGKIRRKVQAEAQKANTGKERSLLVSTLRRVAKVNPEGVGVRFYTELFGATATIGIELEKEPISLDFKALRLEMFKNEGYTFFLGDPLGPYPTKDRRDFCHFCHLPRDTHREDGRCSIKGCTLSGPPKESK